jgi:hypothetical protein
VPEESLQNLCPPWLQILQTRGIILKFKNRGLPGKSRSVSHDRSIAAIRTAFHLQ